LSNALQKKQFYEQKQQNLQQQVPAQPSQQDAFTYAAKEARDQDASGKGQVATSEADDAARQSQKPAATPTAVASSQEPDREKAKDAAQDKNAEAATLNAAADAAVAVRTPQTQEAQQRGEQRQQQEEQEFQPVPQPVPDTQVVAINAYGVTRKQVEDLGRALNRSSQRVELIADDEQIQIVNAGLQRMLGDPLVSTTLDAAGGAGAGRYSRENGAPSASQQAAPQESAVAEAVAVAPAAPAAPPAADAERARAAKRARTEDLKSEPTELATAAPKKEDVNSKTAARGGRGLPPPVIRAGNELYVTVDELKGPDTEPTSQHRVADDGTVELRQLKEPLRVEGLSRAQAAQAIADAYKRSGMIDSPTVTVEPVPDTGLPGKAAVPTDQRRPFAARESEATVGAQGGQQETGQAAATSGPAPAPLARSSTTTTAPASPTDGQGQVASDEDQKVNVVILVQRNTVTPVDAVNAPDAASDPPESPPATQVPEAAAEPSAQPPAEPATPAENAK
jgi:hypothetical protein